MVAAVRIQNVPLEPRKHIRVALRSIYGIGNTTSIKICKSAGLTGTEKVQDLSDDAVRIIQNEVAKFSVEGDLRRELAMRIKRLMDIGCYRGKMHKRRLPVRGQRTRTNARTRKGKNKGAVNK